MSSPFGKPWITDTIASGGLAKLNFWNWQVLFASFGSSMIGTAIIGLTAGVAKEFLT